MNKAELVTALSDAAPSATKADIDRILQALTTTIVDEVRKGGEVAMPGLGKFILKETAARTGRNPRTGEAMEIAAKKGLSFKPSSVVKSL